MLTRPERRALEKLPTTTTRWEVAVVDAAVRVQGVVLEGMLLVVDERSGFVRGAGAVVEGEPLWPVLRPSLYEPTPPASPARPRALVCADAALAARLRRELEGTDIPVLVVDRMPELDEAAESMVRHFEPVRTPGLTVELPRWAAALALLCRMEPWRQLPDQFAFRFGPEVPELASVVVVLLGMAGEQEGVVVYPSQETFDRFLASGWAGDERPAPELEATCLYVDPADELHPTDQAEVRRRGLALPGNRMPRVVRLLHGELFPLDDHDQRVLLAAIEAVVRLCATDLERLLDEPCSAAAHTVLGSVTVRSTPLPPTLPPTLASPFEHAVLLSTVRLLHEERAPEDLPALVVKLAKRDAERLARGLTAADAVEFEPLDPIGVRARLRAGGRDLGVLCEAPLDAEDAAMLIEAPTVVVGLSAGGAKRTSLRPRDLIWSARLATVRGDRPQPRHDVVFDRPMEEWPKASDTLMRYATTVFGPVPAGTSPQQVLQMLQIASTVWCAVVLADFGGQRGPLDEMHRTGAPIDLLEALVLAKRQRFPGDPRLILDVTLQRGKEPRFHASARLPVGYTVGGAPT
jgi:hypothetical protein